MLAGEGPPSHLDGDPDEDEDGSFDKRFNVLGKLGEGTYGTVYKASNSSTGQLVAIKKMKIQFEDEGVPATALREISLIQECRHPNIVQLHDVFSTQAFLFLIFECLDMDLREFIKQHTTQKFCRDLRIMGSTRPGSFRDGHSLRNATAQCFRGLAHCHGRRILHRDLKPQNVLVDLSRTLQPGWLKLADFGLARAYNLPLRAYTHEVVTLWYRSPEILMGQQKYGPSMDIWSMGCIFSEMATGSPLFPGDSEIDTLFKIFRLLGTPTNDAWPGVTSLSHYVEKAPQWRSTNLEDVRRRAGESLGTQGLELLQATLQYIDSKRPSAKAALDHPFLQRVEQDIEAVSSCAQTVHKVGNAVEAARHIHI